MFDFLLISDKIMPDLTYFGIDIFILKIQMSFEISQNFTAIINRTPDVFSQVNVGLRAMSHVLIETLF